MGADRRTQLLAGAAKALLELGYERTRVEDILVASASSRGTYYRFFHGKEDAAVALFDLALRWLLSRLGHILTEAAAPTDRVLKAVDAFLELSQAHGPLVRLLRTHAAGADPRIGEREAWVFEQTVALIQPAVAESLGTEPTTDYARALLYAADGLVLSHLLRGPLDDDAVAHIRAVIAPLVERALRAEGAAVPR